VKTLRKGCRCPDTYEPRAEAPNQTYSVPQQTIESRHQEHGIFVFNGSFYANSTHGKQQKIPLKRKRWTVAAPAVRLECLGTSSSSSSSSSSSNLHAKTRSPWSESTVNAAAGRIQAAVVQLEGVESPITSCS